MDVPILLSPDDLALQWVLLKTLVVENRPGYRLRGD